ncbi:MAG: hypothetical protein EBY29_17165, partial [Planctomycetes bacterium]|nr:hypothetical protein [Planctomycetota bacterium]
LEVWNGAQLDWLIQDLLEGDRYLLLHHSQQFLEKVFAQQFKCGRHSIGDAEVSVVVRDLLLNLEDLSLTILPSINQSIQPSAR